MHQIRVCCNAPDLHEHAEDARVAVVLVCASHLSSNNHHHCAPYSCLLAKLYSVWQVNCPFVFIGNKQTDRHALTHFPTSHKRLFLVGWGLLYPLVMECTSSVFLYENPLGESKHRVRGDLLGLWFCFGRLSHFETEFGFCCLHAHQQNDRFLLLPLLLWPFFTHTVFCVCHGWM